MTPGVRRGLSVAVVYAALLGAWEAVAWSGLVDRARFSSPSRMVTAMGELAVSGELGPAVVRSLWRQALGYALGALAGVAAGAALWRYRTLGDALGPLVTSLQTLPGACWLPLALVWFGAGETAVVFVVVIGSALIVASAVENGIRRIPTGYVRAGRMMGLSGPRLVVHVFIPAALPVLVEGLKRGWVFGWRALMSGELIYDSRGLGELLNRGSKEAEAGSMLVVVVVIVAVGIAVDRGVFEPLQAWVDRRWGRTA